MAVFQLYKPFRNKVSLLAYDDALRVIWAYSQYLQFGKKFRMPRDIEVHEKFLSDDFPQRWLPEWILELIAKEVILNGTVASRKNITLRSWKTLAALVDRLKDLEDRIYRLHSSNSDVLIELIRIAHRQFAWQQNPPNAATMIRYFIIFNTPEINRLCEERIGLTVEDIYLCGTAFMGIFFSHPAVNLPIETDIKWLSREKIARFLALTCRTVPELKAILGLEQKYDSRFAYAYNSLRGFPLIRLRFFGRDAVACPLPTLLFWRITAGLYYALVDSSLFTQSFGNSFQQYVGEAARRAVSGGSVVVLEAQEYGTKKATKESADWLIFDETAVLFLECKAKRVSWDAKAALEDLRPLHNDIDQLADAVVQVYRTIADYESGQYSGLRFDPGRKIYPVIVTLENWHIFWPGIGSRLHAAVVRKLEAGKFSAEVLARLPFSVWAVTDLESGMQIVKDVGVQRYMEGKLTDPEMKEWEWYPYMTKVFGKLPPAKNLFSAEYDSMFSKIAR